MKKKLAIITLLLSSLCVSAQQQFSTFWHQRATLFHELKIEKDDIVFLGNSITNGCEWSELFGKSNIKNRGISGDTTDGILYRLNDVTCGKPDKIFLLIGINDLSRGVSNDSVVRNIKAIIQQIQKDSPQTRIYLQSILPVNECYNMFAGHTARYADVSLVNSELQQYAKSAGITYIDLYSSFVLPGTQKINPELTNDGLHLLGNGYLLWRSIVLPYVEE